MKQFDFDKARDYLIIHLNQYYKTIQETDDRDSLDTSRLAFMTTAVIGNDLGILKHGDLSNYDTDVLFKIGKEKNYEKR